MDQEAQLSWKAAKYIPMLKLSLVVFLLSDPDIAAVSGEILNGLPSQSS